MSPDDADHIAVLIAQILGVALAVALVALAFGGRLAGGAVRLAAAVVAAVALAIALAPQVRATVEHLGDQRAANRGLSATEARERCIVENGGRDSIAFSRWLRERLAELPQQRPRYFLVQSGPPDSVCIAFNLMPAVQVRDAARADVLIMWGRVPHNWRDRVRERAAGVQVFDSTHALAVLR